MKEKENNNDINNGMDDDDINMDIINNNNIKIFRTHNPNTFHNYTNNNHNILKFSSTIHKLHKPYKITPSAYISKPHTKSKKTPSALSHLK